MLCRLMRSCLAVLSMPRCQEAARNATLNVVESLLDMEGEGEGEVGHTIIMSHVDQLLESLKVIVVTAWMTPVSQSSTPCASASTVCCDHHLC